MVGVFFMLIYDGDGNIGGMVLVDLFGYDIGVSVIVVDGLFFMCGEEVFVGWW